MSEADKEEVKAPTEYATVARKLIPVDALPEGAVPPPVAHHPTSVDPALLLVRGKNGENKNYIKSLAHAVVTVITRYGYASLKCVGASSVNNAVKAFTIASGSAKTRGVNLVLESGFQNADFDGVEKTAIVFRIFDR